MSSIILEFERLFRDAATRELTMQDYMEEHTELVPTFAHQLHHGIWLNSVISQPSIGPRKTDFAFLTKHTQQRRVVFVELERPSKKLFTRGPNYVVGSADLNNALDQVRAWREDLRRFPDLLKHIGALFDAAYDTTLDVKYVLVIGTSNEWQNDAQRCRHLSAIESSEHIQVIGYDTIARYLRANPPPAKRCLLAQHVGGFTIKRMAGAPRHLLETLGPDRLHLSPRDRALFARAGYDMERWEQGRMGIRTRRGEPFMLPEEERLSALLEAATEDSVGR
jgi:antiviral defense system Shedu protein SduA